MNDSSGQTVRKNSFGTLPDGQAVDLYTLRNTGGMEARISNYGGIIVSLSVPDRNGQLTDMVLGYNTLAQYLKKTPYFGSVVGRYGNRIANGHFTLDGQIYTLATNNSPGGVPCALHGGLKGFDKVAWAAHEAKSDGAVGIIMQYLSRDGEEGYPGNLSVTLKYWLTDADELKIEYQATTDKPTPVNLTNHSYFNLKGDGQGNILDHELTIAAAQFLPVTKGLIPTGELRTVKASPFDFTTPHRIGERIQAADEQLSFGNGYDHTYVFDKPTGRLALAARVSEVSSGRSMEVWTTEPGVQFYTGNFLSDQLVGKTGQPYAPRQGFCLETQHFPDSPNQPSFPSTILRPGERFESVTVYKFPRLG